MTTNTSEIKYSILNHFRSRNKLRTFQPENDQKSIRFMGAEMYKELLADIRKTKSFKGNREHFS